MSDDSYADLVETVVAPPTMIFFLCQGKGCHSELMDTNDFGHNYHRLQGPLDSMCFCFSFLVWN